MAVCDICEKEDIKLTKIQIGGALGGDCYVLCRNCKRKLKKYIKFEQARRKEQDNERT